MTEKAPQESISERYQQIQALTPSDESVDFQDTPSITISTFLSMSLFIFFFVVIFFGFLPLVMQKFKDFNKFKMALLLAFVGAALPLTMGLMFDRTGLLTQATSEETPQNIIIEVEKEAFSVKWETAANQYGALRYGKEEDISKLDQTILEVNGLQDTQNHEVAVEGLEQETDYYFEILSGARWYDNQGRLLKVTTSSE